MLSHPNIVTVFDVGEIEGRPYIAMELLDGGPLADLLRRASRLRCATPSTSAYRLAHALDYAQKNYHRDIKPNNIIRLRDSRVVKVADFGIARKSGEGSHRGNARRHRDRHAALHVARAGDRRGGRRALRPLGLG